MDFRALWKTPGNLTDTRNTILNVMSEILNEATGNECALDVST